MIYPWAYYLTLALPRYRLPIDPIVLLLLAISMQRLAQMRMRPAAPVISAKSQSPSRRKRKKMKPGA